MTVAILFIGHHMRLFESAMRAEKISDAACYQWMVINDQRIILPQRILLSPSQFR